MIAAYKLARSSVRLWLAGARSSESNMEEKSTGRVIKFRAHYKGKVYEVTELLWSDLTVSLWDPKHAEALNVGIDEVDLLQFTGLHDKNGKEIYEGGILSITDSLRASVGWKQGSWQINWRGTQVSRLGDLVSHEFSVEVIGNIYESPDLLSV